MTALLRRFETPKEGTSAGNELTMVHVLRIDHATKGLLK